jgi:hypothetical protein
MKAKIPVHIGAIMSDESDDDKPLLPPRANRGPIGSLSCMANVLDPESSPNHTIRFDTMSNAQRKAFDDSMGAQVTVWDSQTGEIWPSEIHSTGPTANAPEARGFAGGGGTDKMTDHPSKSAPKPKNFAP